MTVESFSYKLEVGNPLTATRILDESQLNCEWFEKSVLHRNTFARVALRLIPDQVLGTPLSEEAVVTAYTGLDHA